MIATTPAEITTRSTLVLQAPHAPIFGLVTTISSQRTDNFVFWTEGVAGLATAYALRLAGHHVTIYEAQGFFNAGYKGGQRIPPNVSKILKEWVGEDELRNLAVQNVCTSCYDSELFFLPHCCATHAQLVGHGKVDICAWRLMVFTEQCFLETVPTSVLTVTARITNTQYSTVVLYPLFNKK